MATNTLPATAHIGPVRLRVGSIDTLLPFYRETVGIEVVSRKDGMLTLGTDRSPLLHLVEDPTAPARTRATAGLFHLAIRVPDRGALADALTRGKDRSALTGASDHLVSEALYLRDPEGNGVEVYCDRPREEWRIRGDGRVAMDTLPLDQADLLETANGDDRLPAGTDMGHVHLEVTDLDRSVEFYRNHLGLNLRDDGWNGAAFLAAGDYHHHVGLNTWNGRSKPVGDTRGLISFEVVLPDTDSLSALLSRLEAEGHQVDRSDGASVTDPDGIELVLRPD